jgi:hypothetical protein
MSFCPRCGTRAEQPEESYRPAHAAPEAAEPAVHPEEPTVSAFYEKSPAAEPPAPAPAPILPEEPLAPVLDEEPPTPIFDEKPAAPAEPPMPEPPAAPAAPEPPAASGFGAFQIPTDDDL